MPFNPIGCFMAITTTHHAILSHVLAEQRIEAGSINSICEIGEQNWFYFKSPYCDELVGNLIEERASNSAEKADWKQRYEGFLSPTENRFWAWNVARLYYEMMFGPYRYMALDMHGTPDSTFVDLNQEYSCDQEFDLVTNLGTTEHIFNQAQVFKTIHDLTAVNGVMFHGLPHQGQYDHGFFNYQPTFFFDLAAANDYQIIFFGLLNITTRDQREHHHVEAISDETTYRRLVEQNKIEPQAALKVFLRKTKKSSFVMPQQGVYGENPDLEKKKFWENYSRR